MLAISLYRLELDREPENKTRIFVPANTNNYSLHSKKKKYHILSCVAGASGQHPPSYTPQGGHLVALRSL